MKIELESHQVKEAIAEYMLRHFPAYEVFVRELGEPTITFTEGPDDWHSDYDAIEAVIKFKWEEKR